MTGNRSSQDTQFMSDGISKEDRDWLLERAEQTRQRWRDASAAIKKHSGPMRQELEALRVIDPQLPFAVLTVLLKHELDITVVSTPGERNDG